MTNCRTVIDVDTYDEDTCYGDYDTHITKMIYIVTMFENDVQVDQRYMKSEEGAEFASLDFIKYGLNNT